MYYNDESDLRSVNLTLFFHLEALKANMGDVSLNGQHSIIAALEAQHDFNKLVLDAIENVPTGGAACNCVVDAIGGP